MLWATEHDKAKLAFTEVITWFQRESREYFWKYSRDPYVVWISEVMLQQTQVSTVGEYLKNWLLRFPSVEVLAEADVQEVLLVWKGLGYYSRAINLHKAAQLLKSQYASRVPQSYQELRTIPGIGDYTACAILSLAYQQKYIVWEANVARILSRLLTKAPDTSTIKAYKSFLLESFDGKDLAGINQGIMQLGQLICRKNPQCLLCPLRILCKAYQTQTQETYPLPRKKSFYPSTEL